MVIASTAVWLGTEAYAEFHFRQAREAWQRFDFVTARGHLQRCLALRPNRFQFHFAAAQTERRAGSLQLALYHLDRCQELAGDRADVSSLERTLLHAQQGGVVKVEGPLWALVDQDHPEKTLILEALAHGYLRIYSLALADKSLKLLLDQHPGHAEAWFLRAGVCELAGPSSDAADFYRQALELRPDSATYCLRLANFLLQARRPAEALPHLEQLSERRPRNPEVLLALARALNDTGRQDRGRAVVEQALAMEPNYPQALAEIAKLDFHDGKLAQAQSFLRKAVAADPSDRASHYLLFQCLARSGRKDAARQQQEHWRALENDLTRLENIVRKELPQNPRSADLYHELAAILARHGKAERALPLYQHALTCDPGHRTTHQALARYFTGTGDIDLASRHRHMAEQATIVSDSR